jgi:hypothetical protein
VKTENVGYNMKKSNLEIVRNLWLGEQAEPKKTVFSGQQEPVSVDDKRAFAEALNSFSAMSETVKARGQRLQEAVEGISKLVETANRMISESDDDVVEKVAYGRHQKLIEMALKEMQKSASEVMIHERRMEAACEDIREGLSKYYDVQ